MNTRKQTSRQNVRLQIRTANAPEIMAFFSGGFGDLVELGSGSSRKIKTADFEHQAIFVEEKERVEMHLRATRETSARIAELDFTVLCRKGETIHTEICKKFSRAQAHRDFQRAALKWFTDPQGWFSLVMLKKTRVATVGADIQEKEEN